jgi:hypothetical protein
MYNHFPNAKNRGRMNDRVSERYFPSSTFLFMRYRVASHLGCMLHSRTFLDCFANVENFLEHEFLLFAMPSRANFEEQACVWCQEEIFVFLQDMLWGGKSMQVSSSVIHASCELLLRRKAF